MREKEVTFTARFRARIRIAETEEEKLNEENHVKEHEAIADIDIPENHQCFYVEGSFDIESVKPLNS